MWNNLPSDILSIIFSYLSPDSLARARSACRHWHMCANAAVLSETRRCHPAWFLAVPTRSHSSFCYAHNPADDTWHTLVLDFIPSPFRPIAPVDGLILVRLTSTLALRLAVCNPFTRQFKHLPMLNIPRTNPAIGIMEHNPSQRFSRFSYKVYVAGGMSDATGGGASYESTVEMYDALSDTCKVIASVPMEFAVRLTVWTPNESVYSNGVLYWITSARAFSVMAFEIGLNKWRELSVPLADKLEFAALVPRRGRLALVGGLCDGDACIWELGDGEQWSMIEKVPFELAMRFLGGKSSWGSTRCVGIDGAVCLYRDLGSGMVVWREVLKNDGWEWFWLDGNCSIKGKRMQNFSTKGLLLHPNLAPL